MSLETDIASAISGAGTVTSITAGTGLSGGVITSAGTVALANTAVTPAAYTNASLTVDQQGRLTAASSGTAGASTLVQTQTAAASASLSFALGAFSAWRLIGNVLLPGTLGAIAWLRLGTGGGPTYAITGYNYGLQTTDSTGTAGTAGAANGSSLVLYTGGVATTDAGVSFDLTIITNSSTQAVVMGTGFTKFNGAVWVSWRFGGNLTTATAITGVQFLFSTGTIATGTVSLYGISQ